MKKMLCALAVATMVTGSALAAPGSYMATAQLSPDLNINIDGTVRTFYNAQREEVHPLMYNDTTYVPIRAIGEIMGKLVNWDATTNTATLYGTRTESASSGILDNDAKRSYITVRIEPGYKIVIDGVSRTFYDVDGRKVDPLLYDGSIYLPIRAIGEIMGKTVSWDGTTETVYLSGDTTGGDVTDFDTSTPSGGNQSGSQSGAQITLERAKQIALEHAGVSASQATFVRAHLDYDDGRWEYEVEFIVSSGSGYTEYDYDIDAASGRILSYDRDAEYYRPSTPTGNGSTANVQVSEATARQTALSRVPGASAANIYEFKLDYDDGRWEYEGKIIYNYMEYEFSIDANTGRITGWEVDSVFD